MKRETNDVDLLLGLLDQAFDTRAWHGTNLRGSVRGLTPAKALWRPAPARHCIWEIVQHCAYWKYAVHRRIAGGIKRGSFPLGRANWPRLPQPADARAWRSAVGLLGESHARLRDAVASLRTGDLGRKLGTWTVLSLLTGIASHDLYHAGQIQLLKRLQKP
jgi:DinB superfamily